MSDGLTEAILRGDRARLSASASDVQDAAQLALQHVRLQLEGAVEALHAFATDKWGTTNPILVPDDERELQRAYYRATGR